MRESNISSLASMLTLTYLRSAPKCAPPLARIPRLLRKPSQSSPSALSHFNHAKAREIIIIVIKIKLNSGGLCDLMILENFHDNHSSRSSSYFFWQANECRKRSQMK